MRALHALCFALLVNGAAASLAHAADSSTNVDVGARPALAWDARIFLDASSKRVSGEAVRAADRPDRFAAAIASAGNAGFVEEGTAGSRQAILECNKGDYPGGGMGLLSLPQGRPSATGDHCRW